MLFNLDKKHAKVYNSKQYKIIFMFSEESYHEVAFSKKLPLLFHYLYVFSVFATH